MADLKVNTQVAATEIYRFASLRAVNSPEKNALKRRFVKLELSPTQQRSFNSEKGKDFLLNRIPELKKQPDPRKNILDAVTTFFNDSDLKILSVDDLRSSYPDFHDVYLWLRENNGNKEAKLQDFKTEIEDVLKRSDPKTIDDFVGKNKAALDNYYPNKIRLWENLVAYYHLPLNYPVIEEISKLIRWFWIMEKINDGDLKDGQDIYEASKATILLPKGISRPKPAPPSKEDPKPPNEVSPENPLEEYRKRLQHLLDASKEIAVAYRNQNLTKSYADDCVGGRKRDSEIPPQLLGRRYVDSFSEDTHKVIESLSIPKDIFHVSSALASIDEEKKIIYPKTLPASPQKVAMQIGSSVITTKAPPFTPYLFPPVPDAIDPLAVGKPTPNTVGNNIRMGMADLKVIQTRLLKYDLGEVAHIENVLLGETKNRTFRELNRTEQTFLTEEETTTESEKDTQSTDRFELNQEISKIQKEDMKVGTSLNVTADLGTVKINASADFSYATSKEESNKIDTKSSKELVSRALSRINERKRTQTTITTLKETEDTSVHVLNNFPGEDHIAGVYTWVDKYYIAQVRSYGKHLMLDFVVPEPAAFYLYSKLHKKSEGLIKTKPDFPRIPDPASPDRSIPLASFKDITEDNYALLAAQYNAIVSVYPAKTTSISKSFSSPAPAQGGGSANVTFATVAEGITIEDGYKADWAQFHVDWDSEKKGYKGGKRVETDDTITDHDSYNTQFTGSLGVYYFDASTMYQTLRGETGVLPVAIHAHTQEFVVSVEVFSVITDGKIEGWQLETFNAIMTGYNNQVTAYENWLKEKEINDGVYISGNNPDRNRQIEKEELKKNCIELLTAQRFEAFDAMRDDAGAALNDYPEFSFPDADDEGRYIQFFEQIFLWDQITYTFYPYFWGRREKWVDFKSIEDPDPLFTKFLQAGAARVLVPVRRGMQFENALQYFLDPKNNGAIWKGQEAPLPNDTDEDSLWISIVDELKEDMGHFETPGTMEDKPWIVKMPTNLVYLHSTDPDKKPILPNNTKNLQDLLALVEDKSMLT